MPISLIKKNQLDPDIADLVGQYGSGYFLSIPSDGQSGYATYTQLTGLSGFCSSSYVATGIFESNNILVSSQFTSLSGMLTGDYVKKLETGLFITSGQTGIFTTNDKTGIFITSGQTGAFVGKEQTGIFVTKDQTGTFITEDLTGLFIGAAQACTFVTTGETGAFITTGQTGSFYSVNNPSGFFNINTLPDPTYLTQIVKNGSNSVISKGQPVYISDAVGSNLMVVPASNTGDFTSSKTLGLLYDTLAVNATGRIITEGLLSQINTISAVDGDPVWLGPTGNLVYGTANKPFAPAHMVYLGVVARAHQTQGSIYVKVQNGFELGELHDVNIARSVSLQNNDIIQYDSNSGIWFNRQLQTGSFVTTGTLDNRINNLSGNCVIGNGLITNMVSLTQAQFNLITTPSPTTVYLIVG